MSISIGADRFKSRGNSKALLSYYGHHIIYYPKSLHSDERLYTPIVWANGSFTIPLLYDALLKHLASWGYIVIASWSPMPVIDQFWFKSGLRALERLNNHSPRFKNRINLENIGVSGHSQGGGVSLALSRLPSVKATVAIQPAPVNCQESKNPLLIITSNRDIFVWPKMVYQRSYKSSKASTYWMQHLTASHLMPMFSAKDMRAPITAFFQWHLSNNEKAQQYFHEAQPLACDDERWIYKFKSEWG